jgi:ABC-type polysaccharide/polyol phosphate export permease
MQGVDAHSATQRRRGRAPGAPTSWGRGRSSHAWLVLQFALKDFKIRYTHSTLGYAWSVLNPLLFFLIYYFVFTTFMRLDVPNYPGFLLLGVALWNFYSEGTTNGASSLLARADLLTKTVVPRQIMVYAALMSAALTFVINLIVLMIVLSVTGTPLGPPALCFLVLLFDLVVLTLGTALLLAPLYVRYRDVGYLWNIALQIGFWLTPIIYLDIMVPDRYRWIVWINPVGRVIGDSRRALIYGRWPGLRGLILTTLMSAGVGLFGWVMFRRMQGRLVEHL